MNQIVIKDSDGEFAKAIRDARGTTVDVVLDGEIVGVLVSPEHAERLRALAWNRVAASMERTGAEARRNGLTNEVLEELLADES